MSFVCSPTRRKLPAAGSGVYIKHNVYFGQDWLVIAGVEEGISQVAFPASPTLLSSLCDDDCLMSNDDLIYLSTASGPGACAIPQHIAFTTGSTVVWNMPLEIAWQSTNVYGWPQLTVSLYGPDFLGRDVVKGYGSCRVPREPGRHSVYVPLFTPVATTPFNGFLSWLLGTPPEFADPMFPAKSKGREATRVRSCGTVKIVLNCVLQDFDRVGYR
ncbi:hypothetical protein RI367_001494 [Sorochytrium milnesiophthora]